MIVLTFTLFLTVFGPRGTEPTFFVIPTDANGQPFLTSHACAAEGRRLTRLQWRTDQRLARFDCRDDPKEPTI